MKAVIMAGGFGTRIQPLTSSIPKPMLPVMNIPMMEYILLSLRESGITEFVILLYFKPEVIKDHFGRGEKHGVKIDYVIPDDDYGTAGAVKKGEKFLDDDFIVISGDLITDFDINEIIGYHKVKGSSATICLTSVDDPLQFGVVITDKDGKILRFLEKPGWGEVFSDTINTGIYVFNKDILRNIPADDPFDFSKDLFPLLMKKNIDIYGYHAKGYWRDVGNPTSYREALIDIIKGKVDLPIKGKLCNDENYQCYSDENCSFSNNSLKGFVVLGKNVKIAEDAIISNCSLGDNVEIGSGCVIEDSVVWNDVKIGHGCIVKNAVLCNNVNLGKNVNIHHGGIIAEYTEVGDFVIFEKDIMVWPNKQIEEDSILSSNLIWGDKWKKSIFEGGKVSARTNVELSPELTAKLGAALGSVLPKNSNILLSRDYHNASRMLKRSFLGGVLSSGVNAMDLRMCAIPLTKHTQKMYKNDICVHFRQSPINSFETEIMVCDSKGLPIDSNLEKNIERIFFRENFRRASHDDIGKIQEYNDAEDKYLNYFMDNVDSDFIQRKKFKVVADLFNGTTTHVFPKILNRLGVEQVVLNAYQDEKKLSRNLNVINEELAEIRKIVLTLNADIGFAIFQNGERVQFISNDGEIIAPDKINMLYLKLLDMSAERRMKAYLPIMVPSVLDDQLKNVTVVRGKSTGVKAEFLEDFDFIGGIGMMVSFPNYMISPDAMYNAAKLLELMAKTDVPLSEVLASIPEYFFSHNVISCPFNKKGLIMRKMSEDAMDKEASYVDGIKITFKKVGSVLMIPDQYSANVHLYVEANSAENRKMLLDDYKAKITAWIDE